MIKPFIYQPNIFNKKSYRFVLKENSMKNHNHKNIHRCSHSGATSLIIIIPAIHDVETNFQNTLRK